MLCKTQADFRSKICKAANEKKSMLESQQIIVGQASFFCIASMLKLTGSFTHGSSILVRKG